MNNQFIGDQESLRQINLSTALTHSRQSAPISRAALAEITRLNWATITRLLREAGFRFLHADWLSILLQLNPDAGCFVFAEIKVEFDSLVLTVLSADILWHEELDFGGGAGSILNQRIMAGASGLAGEIGLMTIKPDGPKCNRGSQGCLETDMSALAVFRRVREAADIVVATYLNDASPMGSVATVYSQILSNPDQAFRARRGLMQSQEVIHK